MVKVSIIVPVYNTSSFLQKCLGSICNQTLLDIEIICINDCSTDNSLLVLQELAKNDNRIKIINFEKNQGAAIARNIGIENASGEYLGFVDSDDFIDLNFYEKLYEKAKKTDAEVVKGDIMIYSAKTNHAKKESWIDLNEKIKSHKANFYFSFTTAIYKTSFIQNNKINFLEGLVHFEDPYFTIKAAIFYQKLEVVDNVYYYYSDNPNSSSRKNINVAHINSLSIGIKKVLQILDADCLEKTHYIIVFCFLLEQILCWCNRIDVSDEINIKAVDSLFFLYSSCKYKEECAKYYFLQKKTNQKKEIMNQLRNRVKNDIKNS